MTKRVFTVIEVIKIFVLSWFVSLVQDAGISSNPSSTDLVVIGHTFIIMLLTLIISSIVVNIFFSFFIKSEKRVFGEWERIINKNVLQNFSYALSAFSVFIMAGFALGVSFEMITWIFRIGFFTLTATVNLTEIYYYED